MKNKNFELSQQFELSVQNAEITSLTSGKCKREALRNLQLSFCVAQNAITRSESTAKYCAFRGNIPTVAVKLGERGLSESYLATLTRALNEIGNHANLDNPGEVLTYVAKKKVRDSYKANLCDFYQHYAEYCHFSFTKPKYHRDHKIPQIPIREELSLIVSHASKRYALISSLFSI